MRVILGNDTAIKAIAENHINPWPNGTNFAKIAWFQRDDGQGREVDLRLGIGNAPEQHRAGPEKHFEIRPGKTDPQPLPLLREQPGVAHVAVQRGLKIHEQKAQLAHLAAEMFAGQTVRKFVRRRNGEHGGGQPDDRIPANQPGQVLPQPVPVCGREHDGPSDGRGTARDESRREAKANPAHQPAEQRVWIKQLEPQIQQAAAPPPASGLALRRPAAGFEQIEFAREALDF